MSKPKTWFGYLDAGPKSTAVVLDEGLNTGNPNTIYLFNLSRRQIVEYSRAIAEPKLRELGAAEASVLDELKAAFAEARRDFKARGAALLNIPERGGKAARASNDDREALPESEDYDDSEIDLDLDEDSEDEDAEDEEDM